MGKIGRWLSLDTPVSSTNKTYQSSTNKTDRHDITEILLKVMLNTINQTKSTITSFSFVLSNEVFFTLAKYHSHVEL